MEDLKPCPFCGCEAVPENTEHISSNGDNYYWYNCENDDCGCEIGTHKTREQAVEAWNNRA